jgi:hypothetical protein
MISVRLPEVNRNLDSNRVQIKRNYANISVNEWQPNEIRCET